MERDDGCYCSLCSSSNKRWERERRGMERNWGRVRKMELSCKATKGQGKAGFDCVSCGYGERMGEQKGKRKRERQRGSERARARVGEHPGLEKAPAGCTN